MAWTEPRIAKQKGVASILPQGKCLLQQQLSVRSHSTPAKPRCSLGQLLPVLPFCSPLVSLEPSGTHPLLSRDFSNLTLPSIHTSSVFASFPWEQAETTAPPRAVEVFWQQRATPLGRFACVWKTRAVMQTHALENR